jgi:acetyl-CoA C-acetyltransferase
MGGAFQNTPASDLASFAMKAAIERAGLQPEQIDQVVVGCAGQVGGCVRLSLRGGQSRNTY